MAKVAASHTESALADLRTSSPRQKAEDHDSHAGTQQHFRFMDLPPELRDIIYSFAFCRDTQKTRDGEIPDEPLLTAGLSNSTTARALSQVCRTVRQESVKIYYSETTFVVRGFPDRFAESMERWTNGGKPVVTAPDPHGLWAKTWGVLGAQHIRSLYTSPLKGSVRLSMADEANPISFDEGLFAHLSASELEAAGSKAFGRSGRWMTAAMKIEIFLRKVGDAWQVAWRKEAVAEIRREHNGQQCVCS